MALLQAAGLGLGQALSYVKMYDSSISSALSLGEGAYIVERPRAALGTGEQVPFSQY